MSYRNSMQRQHFVLEKSKYSLDLVVFSRWREIDERSKIEAKMFEKAEFTWGK